MKKLLDQIFKKQIKFDKKIHRSFYVIVFFVAIFLFAPSAFGDFSCFITTQSDCSMGIVNVTLLRMSGSTNAHAELPVVATRVYDDNVVCCSGIFTGLGNSCSGNNAIFARMSGDTNAHVEENTEKGENYKSNACLSSKAGDIITVGYQSTNCNGYDTTLFSMSNTPTNSMVGIPTAYTNKVCASVFSASLTLEISSATVALGAITASTTGSGSHTAQIATNATGGFLLTYNGPTLTATGGTIPAYGSQVGSSAGTAGFGINMKNNTSPDIGAELVQNSGICSAPVADYGTADKFSYVASTTTSLTNQTTPADCTYTVSYVANVSPVTPSGSYSAPITYIASGTF